MGSAIFLIFIKLIWQVIKELTAYISGEAIISKSILPISCLAFCETYICIVLFFSNRIISIVNQPL